MVREQQMLVRKLYEQQGIKPINTDVRMTDLEAWLKTNSQLNEGDVTKKEGETPPEPAWGETVVMPW